MANDFTTQLGQRIKTARENAGLTQSQLAEIAEVSTNHISALVRYQSGIVGENRDSARRRRELFVIRRKKRAKSAVGARVSACGAGGEA